MTNKERPSWYASNYRGGYNWKSNKPEIYHKAPIRCPYCGFTMDFCHWFGYEVRSRGWYWQCPKCFLRLPNLRDFEKKRLDQARRRYRKQLQESMEKAREKYKRLKNLYNQYGRYFTPEEKRNRLIETIEEQKPEAEDVE